MQQTKIFKIRDLLKSVRTKKFSINNINCFFFQIVYKLVPGLLEDELKNEREFWEKRGVPFKSSKSHLLKIDQVQKMLGQDVDRIEV